MSAACRRSGRETGRCAKALCIFQRPTCPEALFLLRVLNLRLKLLSLAEIRADRFSAMGRTQNYVVDSSSHQVASRYSRNGRPEIEQAISVFRQRFCRRVPNPPQRMTAGDSGTVRRTQRACGCSKETHSFCAADSLLQVQIELVCRLIRCRNTPPHPSFTSAQSKALLAIEIRLRFGPARPRGICTHCSKRKI